MNKVSDASHKYVMPDRKSFEADPFGYSALGRFRWGIVAKLAGFSVDMSKPATTDELKNPLLWMTQAEALTQAAVLIIRSEPNFENMPVYVRGICHGQFYAAGLMLIGYSLEICLKAMLIIKLGISTYTEEEKRYRHHRLHKLVDFIPDLDEKDMATLELLTHYIYWAGRYPDPGYGKEDDAEIIFTLSEKHQITVQNLIDLATRIMKYINTVLE